MSIKVKLALIFSLVATLLLILNSTLSYYSTKSILLADQKNQAKILAEEISIVVENGKKSLLYIEDVVGKKLRIASIAAQEMLDPDIENVTNEELREISEFLGIAHISLFKQTEDDIISYKSSDPHDLNLSTKEWGYWYTAFQQLFKDKNVTIPEGQKLPNYWAGPLNVQTLNTEEIYKWGYYYDGTTNYIIDPYVRDEDITGFNDLLGPNNIINEIIKKNSYILEITVFNPKTFGQAPVLTHQNGQTFVEPGNKEILYGTYTYIDSENDSKYVKDVMETGSSIQVLAELNGQQVIKHFVPISSPEPYVASIVTDKKVVASILNKQLLTHVYISLFVLLLVYTTSHLMAGYLIRPIQRIYNKVKEIAEGNFGATLEINRKDELGILAQGVNTMSKNLALYKEKEQNILKSEKLSIVGQLAAGVAHEIRNPLTALNGFIALMKKDLHNENGNGRLNNEKYLEIMDGELKRIESIVSELLMVAKPQALNVKKKDIKAILNDVINLVQTQATMNNIEIIADFNSKPVMVSCDENQIKQVMINVLKNAIEAMNDGGHIFINVDLSNQEIVKVLFIDEGIGIPDDRLTKLGEPFYTTKEKGTGLGLMVSQKIMQQHQGKMHFTSQMGKGTTVELSFPLEDS